MNRRPNIRFNLSPEMEAARQLVANRTSKTTVREWLARGLLPGGFPPDRHDIAPDHQLTIIARHPGLYRHANEAPGAGVPPFAREGFAVGAGWLGIIERLSAKLAVTKRNEYLALTAKSAEAIARAVGVAEKPSRPEDVGKVTFYHSSKLPEQSGECSCSSDRTSLHLPDLSVDEAGVLLFTLFSLRQRLEKSKAKQ